MIVVRKGTLRAISWFIFPTMRDVELPYFTSPRPPAEKKKDLSKVKHSCPVCGMNVWGKLGISVRCGDCDEELSAVE